ncbi:MAG: DUF1848 domain-containing protein [Treponema sp.]|jgi:hypothetical protein|nr:DUF1848 domain-containing protein [Treponema sp.]
MIISASRRTDIPAFLGEWFMECLRAGEVFVKNPVNGTQVSLIDLSPEAVDCLVFWTKNPAPFLSFLDELDGRGYRYYFQFTLTPYGRDIERNLPEKNAVLDTFCRLSERLGKGRVIWRYDPILYNNHYTPSCHAEKFEEFCAALAGKTEKCVISFIDSYSFLKKSFAELGIRELTAEEISRTAAMLHPAAEKYGITLASCCEKADLALYGIEKNKCIDAELINRLFSLNLRCKKDPGQRPQCCCAVSRDIGSYHTCLHGCRYCYAARGPNS